LPIGHDIPDEHDGNAKRQRTMLFEHLMRAASPRQRELLDHLIAGASSRDLPMLMGGVSAGTVRRFVQEIKKKAEKIRTRQDFGT
jgi:hypothetical protein